MKMVKEREREREREREGGSVKEVEAGSCCVTHQKNVASEEVESDVSAVITFRCWRRLVCCPQATIDTGNRLHTHTHTRADTGAYTPRHSHTHTQRERRVMERGD